MKKIVAGAVLLVALSSCGVEWEDPNVTDLHTDPDCVYLDDNSHDTLESGTYCWSENQEEKD